MKNRAAFDCDDESAETAMQIRQKTRAPMITGRKRNFDRAELDRLPVIEFMHDVETEIVHQIAHADWNHDRLIGRDLPQGAPVEMIEMRVRHQDEIDLRQVMNLEPGLLQPLDHFEPFRPVRIDQDVDLMRLDQK